MTKVKSPYSIEAPKEAYEIASQHRLLLVANPLPFHVGGYFISAAQRLGVKTHLADVRGAGGEGILQKIYWRLADRRYLHQRKFDKNLLTQVDEFNPTVVLTVGICPVSADTVKAIRKRGISCVNFLTDDPFNKHHYSKWFARALPNYQTIYSPRYANHSDLKHLGCREVSYLPFAFDPEQHYPEENSSCTKDYDAIFIGGADDDRLPFIQALGLAGIKIIVLGGYWDRYKMSNVTVGGLASVNEIRRYSSRSRMAIILVRHNNRDGHVMRTFEGSALGSCLAVEDTSEHRSIFGDSDDCVRYFSSVQDLVTVSKELLANQKRSRELAMNTIKRIRCWRNTYDERLLRILNDQLVG